MAAVTFRVIVWKGVVAAVCGVCGNFGGLYIFPGLILVAFDGGCTKWWVLANGLAVETWKVVYVSFVECFCECGDGW